MRHAIAPGGGDPAGFRLGDCRTQRNLSAQGRSQARAIGQKIRVERVPISGVRSSRWCRARDTARLLGLGPVRPSPALDSVFTASNRLAQQRKRQAERLIRDHRGASGVLVFVGHQANIIDLTGVAPASGGAVVVRADRSGSITVIGQIPPP
jgi:phosphohistidine phosphatase SixA